MPFPKILRWALLAPFAAFALAMLHPALFAPLLPDKFLKGTALVVIAVAGVVELFAVSVALFLLLRAGPYMTRGNVIITLLAAIPMVFIIFIVLALKFGHFHI